MNKKMNKPMEILPFYVDFAITYKCNAQCKHCSIDANYCKEDQSEMDTNTIKAVIDELKQIGVLFIGLTGGEAITRSDIYDIINYCVERNILVALASNGIALDMENIQRLKECKINNLFISLDHYNKEIHNKIRNNEYVYDAALNAIKLCLDNEVPITVGITPMKDNYLEINRTIDFIISLGVNVINISNFVPTGRGTNEIDLKPEEWKYVYKQVKNKIKQYENRVRFQVHDVKMSILMPDLAPQSFGNYQGCLAGYTHCYILPNGDVTPCVMLPIKLGNLKKEPLYCILKKYQCEGMVIDKEKLEGKCGNCKFKYKCGGCRANAYAYYKNINAQDPHCWIND